MKLTSAIFVAAAVAVTAPVAAIAAPKPKGGQTAITIASKPNPVVVGGQVTISGRISGTNSGGRSLRLEADPYPYGDGFSVTATKPAENNGSYAFTATPTRNTRYRVVASGTPAASSSEHLVSVRRRVGARVSDSTPRRGQLVTFSGSVLPASVGKSVLVQRRSATGSWVTVARSVTVAAGSDLSRYSKRVRIYRSAAYRVKVPGDAIFVNGISTTRNLTVS